LRQPIDSRPVRRGPIGTAVVGQDPLDPDAETSELEGRGLEGCHRRGAGLVGDRDHDGVAAGVVDDDLEMVIADPAMASVRAATATERPPAAAGRDPSELLVVLVKQRSGVAGDIADRGCRHLVGIAQPAQATPREDPVDGRGRTAQEWPKPVRTVSPARSGGEDLGFGGRTQPAG
jgi:hypothetical protein